MKSANSTKKAVRELTHLRTANRKRKEEANHRCCRCCRCCRHW